MARCSENVLGMGAEGKDHWKATKTHERQGGEKHQQQYHLKTKLMGFFIDGIQGVKRKRGGMPQDFSCKNWEK